MSQFLESLIHALRYELQQYGEMLALLEQQHEAVAQRGAEEILNSIAAINAQSEALRQARDSRFSCQREVAQSLGQAPDIRFVQLIPLLPEEYQPLVAALTQENNDLLERVRETAQQNYGLLQQSLVLMQRFLGTLVPEVPPLGRVEEHDTILMERAETDLLQATA